MRLFTRTARGAQLTIDGQAFLPHARELLRAAERAAASVRPGRRPLRVDVIGRRLGPAGLLRDFHRAHPETELDVVTLFDADAAIAAVRAGTIDASFRAVTVPGRPTPRRHRGRPRPRRAAPAPHRAGARARRRPTRSRPRELAGHRIWMPGIVPGTEWAAYYDDARRRVRPHHRRDRPQLRHRAAAGRDRRLPGAGHLRRRADPPASGPPTTTCGASPCATRRRSTRTR